MKTSEIVVGQEVALVRDGRSTYRVPERYIVVAKGFRYRTSVDRILHQGSQGSETFVPGNDIVVACPPAPVGDVFWRPSIVTAKEIQPYNVVLAAHQEARAAANNKEARQEAADKAKKDAAAYLDRAGVPWMDVVALAAWHRENVS